jgi:hypothetical protein
VGDQGTNAVAALVLGSAVSVLLFIPVAAVQYRRDGRLGAGDLMVLVGAAVYGVSLWTYTLLPLPDVGEYACQQAQTQVMAFADDIRRAAERGGYAGLGTPSELLKNQAFLQFVLNVLLFLTPSPGSTWRSTSRDRRPLSVVAGTMESVGRLLPRADKG